jgi:hypothetical protein
MLVSCFVSSSTLRYNHHEASMSWFLIHGGLLLDLRFNPEDGGDTHPKYWLTFSGLHGVISEAIELLKP